MTIDVVVTTHNRTTYIEDTIKAIRAHIPHGDIIILDSSTNARSKAIMQLLAFTNKTLYYPAPLAIGSKIFLGAHHAGTEWMMVCSDDTIPSLLYWPTVREHLTRENGFVAPNAHHAFGSSWWRDYSYWFAMYPPVCAGSYLVRRSVVTKLFEELWERNFAEDALIRDAVVNEGYRFVPLKMRVALHDHKTLNEDLQKRRAWEYGRSYGRLPLKGTLRMTYNFAKAKLKQVLGFSRDLGFSLPVTLFQGLLVLLMTCGVLNILRPKGTRAFEEDEP